MSNPVNLKDDLTGLYNTRYLEDRIISEFERANRYVFSLSVVFLDIDSFRSVNDAHGREYGDRILLEVAQFLAGFARRNDVLIRSASEEFIFLLPDTRKKGAVTFGRRLREVFREHVFDPKGRKTRLRISVGVANYPEDGVRSSNALLDFARRALENAKSGGRDQIFAFKNIGKDEINYVVRREEEESLAQLKENVSRMVHRTHEALLKFLEAYTRSITGKDGYPCDHTEKVRDLSTAIAAKLNLSQDEEDDLRQAALFYRLGKAGISKEILQKRGELDECEFDEIKKYPELSADIMRLVHFLGGIVPIILCHREWYDGRGYPEGLRGEAIPIGARILGLADAYQALISERPYRKAYPEKEAVKLIQKASGSQFDPRVVEVFLRIKGRRQKADL